jgi:hypothetical protein
MHLSNGINEECVKEMKKIIRANISSAGILDKSSVMAGLQVFRNMPRSPTYLSPAQIFGGFRFKTACLLFVSDWCLNNIVKCCCKKSATFVGKNNLKKFNETYLCCIQVK